MPEDPASIEHRAPAQSPPPPERNYGGCLLPIGIAIGLFGLTLFAKLWKPNDMSPSERELEITRFVCFMLIAIVLIVLGVFLKKARSRPAHLPTHRPTDFEQFPNSLLTLTASPPIIARAVRAARTTWLIKGG